MEVHHHSHTPGSDSHRSKKKWTHYFWEFLMLFLAVFCGFLAENQREHYVEHQREKQFIRSLAVDLKSDIILAEVTLKKLEKTRRAIDSIIVELADPGILLNSNKAYRIWYSNMGFADFFSNDRTIQQLKSSGSMRMIRNKAVSDSIMQYDNVLRDYYGQNDLMISILSNQTLFFELFDFIALDKNNDKLMPVPLTKKGVENLREAYAERKIWGFGLSALIRRLKTVNATAVRALALIQKEYRLK